MTLRTRFTLAVAAAVAAVALAITAVAFLVVRADLTDQVQHGLRQQAAVAEQLARHYHGHIPAGWVPQDSERFGALSAYAQVVTADGTVWAPAGDNLLLPATTAAEQVAAGQRGSSYTEATMDGIHAVVLTTRLAPGLAVQLAEPLNAVDTELNSIGATLVLLSAAGIGLAAVAGSVVARAGLAPLGRLAAVAEQVTATGDPGRRVHVDRADELGRLAASFNAMLGALQRSLAAQRQLVSDASHELRTPLTSLRVNAELLAAEPGMSQAERQEVLDRVVAQAAELGQLVASVTELARGDGSAGHAPEGAAGHAPWGSAGHAPWGSAGHAPGDPTPPDSPGRATHEGMAPGEVDFAGAVVTALEGARRDWPRAVFRAELEPCTVLGDGERLKTAVRNLLDNAAKFSPRGSPVEVGLHAGELTVRDHGPGIPPADLRHVFDRFYRAAAARSVPGSGLGLAIVRQVTENHGGRVQAESPAGGGTLIRLRLPAVGYAKLRRSGRRTPGDLGSVAGSDHDSGRHDHEERDLACDGRWAAAQAHVEPQDAEPDGDDRIGRGDDRLDRGQEPALLEGVLVEDVADRADDGQDVDRPVGEYPGRPAAEFRRHELDREGGDPVADAAGQRERERSQVLVLCRHDQAASDHHDDPDGQRQQDAEGDVRAPA